jgi:hypothetical protein
MTSHVTLARIFVLSVALLAVTSSAWGKDHTYRPSRLPDGKVDLQGMWALKNSTALERLPQFKSLVITKAEAAQVDARREAAINDPSFISPDRAFWDTLRVEPVRGQLRSSVIIDPSNGLIPGTPLFYRLREQHLKAWLAAFDGPEERPNSERCLQKIDTAAPVILHPSIRSVHQLVQTETTVVFASESVHDARIIRMNAKHNPPAITSWLGDAIGWWEGDTLVVETKHFTSSSQNRASGREVILVSPDTVVLERFTRIDHDQLHYVFTVTDPTFYTLPWTGENQFSLMNERMFEDSCHEGNYALGFILRGARAQETVGRE